MPNHHAPVLILSLIAAGLLSLTLVWLSRFGRASEGAGRRARIIVAALLLVVILGVAGWCAKWGPLGAGWNA